MNAATKFYLEQLSPLIGGEITGLVVTPEEDGEQFFGLEIITPEGKKKHLFFLRDDEGNGPGSFEINSGEAE